jgi:hypothetical protein
MRTVFPAEKESELKRSFFGDSGPGFFVEVGANQPFELSQTWDLEQRGWTGILVEPQPDLAAALAQHRSAKVLAEACSSKVNSGKRMAAPRRPALVVRSRPQSQERQAARVRGRADQNPRRDPDRGRGANDRFHLDRRRRARA